MSIKLNLALITDKSFLAVKIKLSNYGNLILLPINSFWTIHSLFKKMKFIALVLITTEAR
jgi:hypothetical protein